MLTIACVLKSGGDYNAEYVMNLAAGVGRNLPQSKSYQFVCMTDLGIDEVQPLQRAGINVYLLVYDLPGWWSKMELFRLAGPVLYFDLDTVILGDIFPLVDNIQRTPRLMLMLRGFRGNNWASGIMGWHGDYRWVLMDFLALTSGRQFDKRLKMTVGKREYRGDQNWLAELLPTGNTPIIAAQDIQPGIMSYKREVRMLSPARCGPIPEDCQILCFHGKPRPHDVPRIAEIWRCGHEPVLGVEAS